MQIASTTATRPVQAGHLEPVVRNRLLRARILLGGLSIFAGIVHLALAGPHFAESTWLGAAFLADGIGLGFAGIWVVLTGTKRARLAAGLVATLTVLAYLGSRTVGLPGMDREAWDALGLATTFAELVVALPWRRPPDPQANRHIEAFR